MVCCTEVIKPRTKQHQSWVGIKHSPVQVTHAPLDQLIELLMWQTLSLGAFGIAARMHCRDMRGKF